jgi:peroxiredoxin
MIGVEVPNVVFKTRVRDESIGGDNPYRWQDVTTEELFAGKKIVLFSLPGAFTPTCSTYQLPRYEELYDEFKQYNVDEVYVLSVNDSFVMNKWLEYQNIKKVKPIPDGSGIFTRQMGMLVEKQPEGFGYRSWRYAAVVEDMTVTAWMEEPGRSDNYDQDPYMVSNPENVLEFLGKFLPE